jgi:hypothetical protein
MGVPHWHCPVLPKIAVRACPVVPKSIFVSPSFWSYFEWAFEAD